MSEVHQLPSTDEAERAASEWIARLNAENASAEDHARFDVWRAAHPRHARAYEELSATWNQFVGAGRLVRAVALGQSLGAVETAPSPRRRWMLAAAATVAAAALAGWWWVETVVPQTLFQTAVGQHASIELPDGSTLELNSNSLAHVDYTEHVRVIRLDRGEAFFKVQHDAQRPFWVVAGNSWVRAVGTAFNVYIRPAGVRVIVSEGSVKVAAGGRLDSGAPTDGRLSQVAVSVLTAGEQADVRSGAAEVRSLQPSELTRSVAWRSGTLYFENQPLGEVIDEISRYTLLEVAIEDDTLRDMRIGGTFQASPLGAETLLTMLEEGFGLQVRRDRSGRAVIVGAAQAQVPADSRP